LTHVKVQTIKAHIRIGYFFLSIKKREITFYIAFVAMVVNKMEGQEQGVKLQVHNESFDQVGGAFYLYQFEEVL
jgi:hypothetical protein